MSDETYENLRQAIEEHLADEHPEASGVMLTGFVLQACGQSFDGDLWPIIYTGLAGQSMVTAQGLAQYLTTNVDRLSFDTDPDDR